MAVKQPCEKERLFELLIHDLTGPLSVISVSTASLLRDTGRNGSLTERQKSTLDRFPSTGYSRSRFWGYWMSDPGRRWKNSPGKGT